jgi:trehalose-6-phosphatase
MCIFKDIETASIAVAHQERLTKTNGEPLNTIEHKKALEAFKTAGADWQRFAKNIIDQEARITSTGKVKDVEAAVEKKKVEVKARPTTKGTASATKKSGPGGPPESVKYGTDAWDQWWARKHMAKQAEKASQYQR